MVAEAEPTEQSENRKSKENLTPQAAVALRSVDTMGTKQNDKDGSTGAPMSLQSQSPTTSNDKATSKPLNPPTIPVVSISGAPSQLAVNQSKTDSNPNLTGNVPSNDGTKIQGETLSGKQKASDDDRDTIDKANAPLNQVSLSRPANESTQRSATIPSLGSGIALSSKIVDKRVSFTSTVDAIGKSEQVPQKITEAKACQSANSHPKPQPDFRAVDSTLAASIPAKPKPVVDAGSKLPEPKQEIEDAKQIARKPLVGVYGSFIHGSDTSLADARKRLRTALDQTRDLRHAFTERVYEKYKVILQPVPTTDQIVESITSDPIRMNNKLQDEIRQVKEEKELEKKDAQKLAAVGIFNTADGKHPTASQAAETADQLAYIGAGLNLVVLPEQDLTNSKIDMAKYRFRGPTNLETGQRNGGISAAAATAAEILLDRVRRSTMMRSERIRREADGSTDEAASAANMLSRYHLLSSSIATPTVVKPSNSLATPPVVPPTKQSKKSVPKASSSSTGSGKTSRGRTHPVVPVNSMLSLNPRAEDLDLEQRPSAPTSALISLGVGSKNTSQQQGRHPYPESLGERRSTMSPNVRYVSDVEVSSLDLPTLPRISGQREKMPLPVYKRTDVATSRAERAIHSILTQFACGDEASPTTKSSDGLQEFEGGNKLGEREALDKPRSRRTTEIGLMRGMQQPNEVDGNSSVNDTPLPERACAQNIKPTSLSNVKDQNEIEPIVAFSVLQGLGLIRETTSSQREQSSSIAQLLQQFNPVIDRSLPTMASPKLLALYEKFKSKKRSFTEAFAADFSRPRGQKKQELQSNPTFTILSRDPVSLVNGESSGGSTEKLNGTTDKLESMQKRKKTECPVLSIRGGGETSDANELPAAPDKADQSALSNVEGIITLGRPKSAPGKSPSTPPNGRQRPSSSSSIPNNYQQSMRASPSDGFFSVFGQNQTRTTGGFSPQRNAGFGLGSGLGSGNPSHHGLQAQAHQLQLQAAINHRATGGDLTDFFGAGLRQRQGFPSQADWAALGGTPVGLLQSHPFNALGITPHQAAMLELSARDRAAHALLAEQQLIAEQTAAVHAAVHRQVLMNAQASQAGLGLFSGSPFGQLGAAHSSAMMSSPASAAALMAGAMAGHSSSHMMGSVSGHLSNQLSESRPSSRHSTSSANSNKGKKPSSAKGRKTIAEQSIPKESSPPREETKEKHSNKRKSTDTSKEVNDNSGDKGLDCAPDAKKTAREVSSEKETRKVMPSSREKSPVKEQPSQSDVDDIQNKPSESDVNALAPIEEVKIDRVVSIDLPPSASIKTSSEQKQNDATNSPAHVTMPAPAGMQFFVPPNPPALDSQHGSHVLNGRIHLAIEELLLLSEELQFVSKATALLDYLQAVGSSVPIPKALIINPLKERLNLQSLKMSGNVFGGQIPSVPREVIVATIIVWLWVQHKESFQRAFAKSGRIDVDPECKWLIQAAVDAASRALMSELANAMQNGGPLAAAMTSAKTKGGTGSAKTGVGEMEKQAIASINVDARVALIISEALMSELCIDEDTDAVLPIYEDLVELLDETRMAALKAKCRERVLLAALVSRYATMSESFAHAYVSSMVRAGEGLGHGELFEMVQDEKTSSSTMIPYDIFSDENGAWEDPCRPSEGFTSNLTGEDLVRRAHARGMILKSLRKMQDRNNLKGGSPGGGPYTENISGTPAGQGGYDGRALQRAPSSGSLGRRKTAMSLAEPSVKAGTGAARATSIHQYNPRHECTPLFWDARSVEKTPYGKHAHNSRPRSLSINSLDVGNEQGKDGRKKARVRESTEVHPPPIELEAKNLAGILRSTEEIDWSEVAMVFQTVNLGGRSKRRTPKSSSPKKEPRHPASATIIAPFCRKIDDSALISGESECSDEEDLSDETMLERHGIVLDQMKERLDKFMEGRTTAGQRARQRAKARATGKSTPDT